jgi:hypothetical protein
MGTICASRSATAAQEQKSLDQLRVRERDATDVQAREQRRRVQIVRRLVPDYANALEQVPVELVGDVLPARSVSIEPGTNAVVRRVEVEEVDIDFAAGGIELLQIGLDAGPRLISDGVCRPSVLQALALHE